VAVDISSCHLGQNERKPITNYDYSFFFNQNYRMGLNKKYLETSTNLVYIKNKTDKNSIPLQ